jgi:4-amino-4-deoxy-L-arabinose transferase-like glycosyltransferase
VSLVRRHPWLLITALVIVNAFVRNASTPLWDQDEAAYAGFARRMIETGNWVVPEFMWSEPHRKPPFLFWSIAVSFKLFGESEFSLRLPTTLATLATYASLWWLGRPLLGERTARLGALVLATSLLVPNLGKIAFTDSWLLLFDTLAALSLWQAIEKPAWRWTLLFWSSVALGLLTKGPPILILSGGLFAWLLLVHPKRRSLWRLHPWFGLPLALLPLLAWGRMAWVQTNGALIRWMIDWYILHRAAGGTVFGQVGPPGYHLLVMLVGLLPWSLLLWSALARLRERWSDPSGRFLIGWLLFGWIVWELTPSKLPAYAIGGYPAMALLLGDEVRRLDSAAWLKRSIRAGVWTAGVLSAVFAIAAIGFVLHFALGNVALASTAIIASIAAGATLLSARAIRSGDSTRLTVTLAGAASLCALLLWIGVMPAVDEYRGLTRNIAQVVAREAAAGSRIVYSRHFRLPSLPFYMGRLFADQVVADSDEALRARLTDASAEAFVLSDDTYQRLRDAFAGTHMTRVDGWIVDGPRRATFWVATKQPR